MKVPPDATEDELDRHARACDTLHLPLLYHVQERKDYACGAAALAHLYCSIKKLKKGYFIFTRDCIFPAGNFIFTFSN